ncbi:MAG: YjgN family protein [Telluria sp.]
MSSTDSSLMPSGGAPPRIPPGPAANDGAAPVQDWTFTFSGSGREYFRIWIVNLFLSVATIGIYSAWAKVRRLQYFDRNTQLAGACFDFDGDPKAILRGRIVAVVLLGAYNYAFGFSFAAGVTVVLMLLAALPFAMRAALRFRMRNTRYRGLRFNFSGSVSRAYLAYLPALLIFLLPAVLLALDPSGKLVLPFLALYFAWPLMHGAMKRYQHKHLEFGSHAASFDVPKRKFYKPYFKALGMGTLALLGLVIVAVAAIAVAVGIEEKQAAVWAPLAGGLVFAYLAYLIAGPYIQVRVGNMVWSHTSFPGVTISSHLKARGYLALLTKNTVLTLLTLGIYRPFGVVRAYEYRLAHMTVHTEGGFEQVAAGINRPSRAAGGDGIADFLGVDLSW